MDPSTDIVASSSPSSATPPPYVIPSDAALQAHYSSPMKQWWREPASAVDAKDAERYTCSICSLFYDDPVELLCDGHVFCKSCWLQWVGDRTHGVVCPLCRVGVNPAEVRVSLFARRTVEEDIKIRCQYHSTSCTSATICVTHPEVCNEVLTMGKAGKNAQDHELHRCVFVTCKVCSRSVPTGFLSHHREHDCTYVCTHCDATILYNRKETHEEWEQAKLRAQSRRAEIRRIQEELEEDEEKLGGYNVDQDLHRSEEIDTVTFNVVVRCPSLNTTCVCKVNATTTMNRIFRAFFITANKDCTPNLWELHYMNRAVNKKMTVAELRITGGEYMVMMPIEFL
jgi:hypothetical protein